MSTEIFQDNYSLFVFSKLDFSLLQQQWDQKGDIHFSSTTACTESRVYLHGLKTCVFCVSLRTTNTPMDNWKGRGETQHHKTGTTAKKQCNPPGALVKALIFEGSWKPVVGPRKPECKEIIFIFSVLTKVKDWIVWLMGKQTSQQTARGFENPDFRGRRTTKGRLSDRQKACKNCLERKTAQNSVQYKAILVLAFPAISPSSNYHSTNRQLSSGATDPGLQKPTIFTVCQLGVPERGSCVLTVLQLWALAPLLTTPHWVSTDTTM